MTKISDHKNKQKKVFWEWHYSFSLSRPHKQGHFLSFLKIQSQGIEQTKTMILFWRFYGIVKIWSKQWLSIIPSISIKFSIWKYFSKFLLNIFHLFHGYRQVFKRPCPFRSIPSICNQRSLVKFGSEHRKLTNAANTKSTGTSTIFCSSPLITFFPILVQNYSKLCM